jgi:hypothetical protein
VIFKGSGFYITDHRKDEQPEYQPDKTLPSEKDNGGKKQRLFNSWLLGRQQGK